MSRVKIIDFGLADYTAKALFKRCGSMHYMAPEIIKKQAYGKEVDIWSIGILMYKLLKLGKHPYLNESLSR